MSDKEQIRSLLKQGGLYKKQSLLNQSREAYQKALRIIEKNEKLPNRVKLIEAVKERILGVQEKQTEVDEAAEKPELSRAMQHLIKKRFSFSQNKDTAAFEAAMALFKFGQYEEALTEFRRLLKEGILPVVAAKNIITCLLTFSSPDVAVAQFGQWVSRESLSLPQLKQLRAFLTNVLEKKDIKIDLPKLEKAAPGTGQDDEEEEGVLDISSVAIQFGEGPLKGKSMEFDVTFQSGNSVSIIIAADRKDLLASFKTGIHLQDTQCYSPIGFFKGTAIVFGKTEIMDGPKSGDYLVEMEIEAE